MEIQTCSKCGNPIESYVVMDDENAYHPGCAPKGFRTEAKAQRREARASHVGVRAQAKIRSVEKRHAKALEKAANLYAEISRLKALATDVRTEMLALKDKGVSDADKRAVVLQHIWNAEFLSTPFEASITTASVSVGEDDKQPEAEASE